ncbi:phage recombination protein Bet [Streptomyces sp. DSM 44915]|uniref:Phage recombination protein Bet n=1 Tax=Streptomyces chisholmiae TaxID=3075540 RepID=A0ABU2K0A0_9ACTN|nr:phage recombination protein Bet [Streptomyces sp. DSM 44915]MDT0270620.1 phage recombination protein Bet [Streptomyces sp. DSM 44915]
MSTEITQHGGALAIRSDQTAWTPEQAAVLQQSGIDNEVTGAELSSFLHLCQRTQLDPFSRQIYLIGRYDRRAGRKVFTPQTSIDGYRVTAHRAAAKAGHSLGYEDTVWCDASGRWFDVWLSSEPPAAAKVVVVRDGQRFPAVAKYSEYAQTNRDGAPIGLWTKMPATMTAKCAEALALRMAFPHDLAGVYTAEEMAQAEQSDAPAPASAPARHLRRVPAGEPDPWATPAPEQPQTAAQGRDYLHEAHQAPDADTIRRIYREAAADGARPVYLEQIAEVGKARAAGAPQPAEEAVDAEILPDSAPATVNEHAAAVAELRAFAAEMQLDDIESDAYSALGAPLADVSAAAIRDLLAQLRGTAA